MPLSQRWREFRIRQMPIAGFLVALGAAVLVWKEDLASPTFMGGVGAIQANVSSPKPGILSQMKIVRLQSVKAGDTVAQVITTDPRSVQSSLAVIQEELHLLRLQLDALPRRQPQGLNRDRLRLDWMDQRVQLAAARVKFQLAENEFRRTERLFHDKLVAEEFLERAQNAKRQLVAEIAERSRLVAGQEKDLERCQRTGCTSSPEAGTAPEVLLNASLKVQEDKLRMTEAELSPITLIVPMDGRISAIHRKTGDNIAAGEPIVTITATGSDRIIGYARQPAGLEAKMALGVRVLASSP